MPSGIVMLVKSTTLTQAVLLQFKKETRFKQAALGGDTFILSLSFPPIP